MKGDAKIINSLNICLTHELTAIHQYYLHAKIYQDRGLAKLRQHEREEAIDEMKHADRLIERILFLEGKPNAQDIGRLHIADKTEAMLKSDLQLELAGIKSLRSAISLAAKAGDSVSEDLFKSLLADEEGHVDWIETQLDLIARLGLPTYEQSQM